MFHSFSKCKLHCTWFKTWKLGVWGLQTHPDPRIHVGVVLSFRRLFGIIAQALFETIWHLQSLLEQCFVQFCFLPDPLKLILIWLEHRVGFSFWRFLKHNMFPFQKTRFSSGHEVGNVCCLSPSFKVKQMYSQRQTQIAWSETLVFLQNSHAKDEKSDAPSRNPNLKIAIICFQPKPKSRIWKMCFPSKHTLRRLR